MHPCPGASLDHAIIVRPVRSIIVIIMTAAMRSDADALLDRSIH
jgi:hypothetical protein